MSASGPRHLVAIGVPADDIPQVASGLELVVRCLTGLGYRQALSELSSLSEKAATDLKSRLSAWAETVGPEEIAILYFGGHGGTVRGRHYLGLPGTKWEKPEATALASEDLLRVLTADTRLNRLLVILDTCNSGQAAYDANSIAASLRDGNNQRAVYLITASRPKEEAGDDQFAVAFHELIRSQHGAAQRSLPIARLVQDLNTRLVAQHATWTPIGPVEGDAPDFFPNPHFITEGLLGVPIEDRPFFQSDYQQHWKPRAIGAESIFQSDRWYFTGRLAALRKVLAWLAQPNPMGKALAITGDAGSGKSALLGCLVTASDPDESAQASVQSFLATLPEDARPHPGIISFAVHLYGKTITDVRAALAGRFGGKPDDVFSRLAASGEKIVLAFDALDEAVSPSEIADKILRPLMGYPTLQILVAARRPDVKRLGALVELLDLDSPDYSSDEDVAKYVERLLLADNETRATPYRGRQAEAHAVSEAVAASANGNYLVAKTIARALMERDSTIDVACEPLPSRVPEAFAQYLARAGERSGVGEFRLRECLTPLAYVIGQGLPLATWERFIGTNPERFLDIASAFVAEYSEDGCVVYRLYHQALAEALRDPKLDADRQSKLAAALYEAIPEKNWLRADWFTRKYFAPLAAAGNPRLLENVLLDARFLATVHVSLLLTALNAIRDPEAKRRFDWLRLASDRLTELDAASRLAHLRLVALQNGAEDLAKECDAARLPVKWRAEWARWTKPPTPHRILRGHKGTVSSVAIADGIIVSGGEDHTVRFWSAATGQPIGEVARHDNRVESVAACSGAAISGGWDDLVRLWDLRTGREISQPLAGHQGRVVKVAISDEFAASAGSDRSLILWDWRNRRALATIKDAHSRSIQQLAIAGELAFSGDEDGVIRCWDRTGEPHLEPIRAPGRIAALAATPDYIVSVSLSYADTKSNFQRWDRKTGRLLAQQVDLWPLINSIAIQGDTVVSGCNDYTIRLFDLVTFQLKAQPFTGHALFIHAVATANGIIASAAADYTVRVWDFSPPDTIGRSSSQVESGSAWLATDDSWVAVARWDGGVEILDLQTGAIKREPHTNIELGPSGKNVIAGWGNKVAAYKKLEEGILVTDIDTGIKHALGDKQWRAQRFVAADGILVSTHDQTLRLWDLETLTPIRSAIDTGTIDAVCAANGVIWIAGEELQRRSLRTGEQLNPPFPKFPETSCLAADSEMAAVGCWNGKVVTYDARTGGFLQESNVHPQARITSIALFQGFVVSGSNDGTVWVWNRHTLQPIFRIFIDTPINCLATTRDGVCAACAAGTVRIRLNL